MKYLGLALIALLVVLPVRAEELSPAAPVISAQAMRVKPSSTGLARAFAKSGMRKVATGITVAYDAVGNVIGVKMDKPTGSEALDKAIMAWAAQVKIETREAGFGSIPVVISL